MSLLRTCYYVLLTFGFDPRRGFRSVVALPGFARDAASILKQRKNSDFRFPISAYPCLGDKYQSAGVTDWHYFYQDLHVARRIFEAKPVRHVDVGSRVDGFVAHVAAFRPIEVIDIRPLSRPIPNVIFRHGDLMSELPPDLVECCDSLSCLHALEHFGLGRYGDPIDYDGYLKGLANLHRILKPGGTLYLSVPVGPNRIEFNAHRVFEIDHILGLVTPKFSVTRLSVIDDKGTFHEDGRGVACRYGCGIFELKRQ